MDKLNALLKLAELFGGGDSANHIGSNAISSLSERYIGKQVILRTYSAGNHFGELVNYDPTVGVAVLKNARRLWRWNTDKGISLSEIAQYGIVQANSKICITVPEQIVAEVIEVLPTTNEAAQTILAAPVYVNS